MFTNNSGWNETLALLLICLILTCFVLICGFLLKKTNGLFLARTPQQFLADRDDPKYEKERESGRKMQRIAFLYALPLCLVAWLVFLYLILW